MAQEDKQQDEQSDNGKAQHLLAARLHRPIILAAQSIAIIATSAKIAKIERQKRTADFR